MKFVPQLKVLQTVDLIRKILSFEDIKHKLREQSSGRLFQGQSGTWSEESIEKASERYVEFLALCKCYPDLSLCPSGFVDEFWHAHILDTRAYADDCEKVFGYYLHHNPHAWKDISGSRKANIDRSSDISLHHFGYDIRDQPATSGCHADECNKKGK